MNTLTKAATLVVMVLAAACASEKSKTDAGTDDSGSSGSSSSPYKGPSTNPSGSGVVGKPTATGTGSSAASAVMPTQRVLYFQFDKSDLSADASALADAWGAWLAANPSAKVRLEGHTDERGTREYNIALGERRGNAVLQALTARGVAERQISVSSFGEERPVATGHDESSWSQNRRVEITQ